MSASLQSLLAAAIYVAAATSALADEPTSSGTGFAVTPDGWLLTNAHVIDGCERVEVKGRGPTSEHRVDVINDLALVKIQSPQPLKSLIFRNTPTRLGEDIVAIGYPLADLLSDSVKITTGNINALAGLRNDTRYIQVSTPIQPGNSGGPVVDRDGFVLGITSATFSKSAADEIGITAQNVNFAIRASVAETFMQTQSVDPTKGERSADALPLQTADLADQIAPSVYQILCYGKRDAIGTTRTAETSVDLPAPSIKVFMDAPGHDAIGFDYKMVRDVSYPECRDICQAEGKCQAITYNIAHKVCFLKDDIVALIRNMDAMASYVSGKAAEVIVSDFTSFSGMDLPGGDYKRLRRSNYLSCFTACIGDLKCKAFSYVPKKAECWLKDRLGKPRATKGVELGIK